MTIVSKDQAMRDITKQALREVGNGISIKREATKLWKLLEPVHGGLSLPRIDVWTKTIRLRKVGDGFQVSVRCVGCYGRAFLHENRIGILPFAGQQVLAHELVHMALIDVSHHHDETFHRTLHKLQEKRWRMDIRVNEVKRWNREAEAIIQRQVNVKLLDFIRQPFDWERSVFSDPKTANPTNCPIMEF